jgi:hypothetical protein
MFDADGQLAQSLARGMKNRVGDRRRAADHRDFAQSLDADRACQWVGLIDETDLDLADGGVERHDKIVMIVNSRYSGPATTKPPLRSVARASYFCPVATCDTSISRNGRQTAASCRWRLPTTLRLASSSETAEPRPVSALEHRALVSLAFYGPERATTILAIGSLRGAETVVSSAECRKSPTMSRASRAARSIDRPDGKT